MNLSWQLQEATDRQVGNDSVKLIFVKTNSFLFLVVKHKYNVQDLTEKQ